MAGEIMELDRLIGLVIDLDEAAGNAYGRERRPVATWEQPTI